MYLALILSSIKVKFLFYLSKIPDTGIATVFLRVSLYEADCLSLIATSSTISVSIKATIVCKIFPKNV